MIEIIIGGLVKNNNGEPCYRTTCPNKDIELARQQKKEIIENLTKQGYRVIVQLGYFDKPEEDTVDYD
jgi:hypothetical protein